MRAAAAAAGTKIAGDSRTTFDRHPRYAIDKRSGKDAPIRDGCPIGHIGHAEQVNREDFAGRVAHDIASQMQCGIRSLPPIGCSQALEQLRASGWVSCRELLGSEELVNKTQ